MKTRTTILFGLSALALAGTLANTTQTVAFASARDTAPDERKAMADAAKARALLAAGNADAAVVHAESAVALRPQVADYRLVLGQAYLKVGRFVSARDAFRDVLKLTPDNGKAALNFALAQIATGDWDAARKTLEAHADSIGASDRGLAIALAGDPTGAVDVLTEAVRTPGADAKARQNLALALALAGRWAEAKTMVAYDVAPSEVDARIAQWADFARPHAAYDQVATLLGVHAVEDRGQPIALALVAPAPVMAQAEPAKVAPVEVKAEAPAAAPVAAMPAAVAVAETPQPAIAAKPAIAFAAPSPVVQNLPLVQVKVAAPVKATPKFAVPYKASIAPVARAWPIAKVKPQPSKAGFTKVAVTTTAPVSDGKFYVQIGAYDSAAVAETGWRRAKHFFVGQQPQGMTFKAPTGTFYRLSVGGFTRPVAVRTCLTYRAQGGKCFVRAGAGDQLAAWAAPNAPKYAAVKAPAKAKGTAVAASKPTGKTKNAALAAFKALAKPKEVAVVANNPPVKTTAKPKAAAVAANKPAKKPKDVALASR